MTAPRGEIVILQYGVHDASYPRNSRVRSYLASLEDVTVQTAHRSRHPRRIVRVREDLMALWRGSREADVLLLSEMRLTHAPLVRLVAWWRGAKVIVDGFIGLHETAIGDWGHASPRSLRARRFAVLDWLAVKSADLYLIDTEVRAAQIAKRHGLRANVLALPVGAPSWATWSPLRVTEDRLRILYYGNYIPLHGVELVVEALGRLAQRRDFQVTFIGDGIRRAAIEDSVRDLGLDDRCRFSGPVDEAELADRIAGADVVLGIFGSSLKARTVVANKVWQGLASGRVVVTQASPAVETLTPHAEGLLVTTVPGSATSLSDTLARVEPARSTRGAQTVHEGLEAHVAQCFQALGHWVKRAGAK